ncbi:hypothetical protein JOE11_003815 [Robbsia andropogonis]
MSGAAPRACPCAARPDEAWSEARGTSFNPPLGSAFTLDMAALLISAVMPRHFDAPCHFSK